MLWDVRRTLLRSALPLCGLTHDGVWIGMGRGGDVEAVSKGMGPMETGI